MIAQSLFYKNGRGSATNPAKNCGFLKRFDKYWILVYSIADKRRRKRSKGAWNVASRTPGFCRISLILPILMLAFCGVEKTGFAISYGAPCPQCNQPLYFLTPSSAEVGWKAAIDQALRGQYSASLQYFRSGEDLECYRQNNAGLLELMLGNSKKAMELLWEASKNCSDPEIEENLRNLLSRIGSR